MAQAGVTLNVRPEADADKAKVIDAVKDKIKEIYGDVGEIRQSEEPLAFGIVDLKFIWIIDENMGTDKIAEELSAREDIASAQIVDFRRALG